MSDDRVVPLPGDYEPPEAPPPSPPSRLHGAFVTGMAISALTGILCLFAFITVGWPDSIRRLIVAGIAVSGVVFLACASAAVFSAARDTYPTRGGRPLD